MAELRDQYQVFLSFRGPDTRYGFTDFLYHGLVDNGVHVFRDYEELRVGEVIGRDLLQAIDDSTLYIPIFSKDYASSIWCLRELARIVDNVSESQDKKDILPIFFHVEAGDVKLQTPLYSNALLKREEKYPKEVEAWRKALAEVGKIRGWNVKEDQSQARIVELVVEEVLERLNIKRKPVTKHLVGIDGRVKYLVELLDVNQDDVRLLGIYGMGGIGKTTIAEVIFNQLSPHFGKYCSFLESIRKWSTKDDIVRLQKKLLCDVGSRTIEKVINDEDGLRRIEKTLSNKKVLVVLDDVDKKEDIKKLIGNNSLVPGSRIIITTRNKATLPDERFKFKGRTLQYEMLEMEDDHALQLFCQHALGEDFPSGDYRQLSSEIVSKAGGLPLAIREIGSSLYRKDQESWKKTPVRLMEVPEKEIMKNLRISYDALEQQEQQMFLDIACFFFNENKNDAVHLWNDLYSISIEVLIDRCLIKILENDEMWMHNQLIYMGWKIIRDESPYVRKRSRLWITQEALEIIRTEETKDEVHALKIDGLSDSIEITDKKFKSLPNLRILKLYNRTFTGNFANCHSQLRWLSWQPPLREFRAKKMHLRHLVVFKLGKNDFADNSKAWALIKSAEKLKVLSLTDCDSITTNPDFSKCSGLEGLTLKWCKRLKKLEGFMENPRSLIKLEIEWCSDLTDLPEDVGALVNLKRFSLWGCHGLKKLPSSFGNLTSLTELNLSGTGITELPNSMKGLVKLEQFLLTNTMIKELPNFLGKLTSLCEVSLSKDRSYSPEDNALQLPNGINMLKNLKKLDLSGRDCGIPTTINELDHLETLNLLDCHEIQELPMLPRSLTCLLVRSNSLRSLPNLSNLTNLVELVLSDGSSLTNKSYWITGSDLRWIGRLFKLKRLELDLLNVPAPSEFASLSNLEELTLGDLDLKTLGRLPSSLLSLKLQFCSIRELTTLLLSHGEAEDIPLDELQQLKNLEIHCCKLLRTILIPAKLGKLRQATVSFCPELVDIQIAGPSKSLESFFVYNCEALTRICGLSCQKKLEKLEIGSCNALTDVEGLNELESLRSFKVSACESCGSLIDAFCAIIPDDCHVRISGYRELMDNPSKSSSGISLEWRREEFLSHTLIFEVLPEKTEHPFAIDFLLQTKRFDRTSRVKWRKKKDVAPLSVMYDRWIADLVDYIFAPKRMWNETPGEDRGLLVESGKQVKEMVRLAYESRSIPLIVKKRSLPEAVVMLLSLSVAFVLFLWFWRRTLDFPRKIRQFAGLRRFNHWEDFVVIVVLELFLFFGSKIIRDQYSCDSMNLEMLWTFLSY